MGICQNRFFVHQREIGLLMPQIFNTITIQKLSEAIVLIITNEIFVINEHNFSLINKTNVASVFTQYLNKQIIGAVNMYTGKTIYFSMKKPTIWYSIFISKRFSLHQWHTILFQYGRYFEYN